MVVIGLALVGLVGCATTQSPLHDPEYAPVMPAVVPPPQTNGGAIFQPDRPMALFADVKARQVGDLLTIVLTEKTNASKSASTSASKYQDIDIEGPTIFGRTIPHNGNNALSISGSAGRDFEGDGESEQSNQLSGQITCTVAEVLPNGNLVVRGEKVMTLNQGDEFIRISGIVRPADIKADNTVESTKVANARIIYGGRGVVAESNQMGWLARFFHSVIWPF